MVADESVGGWSSVDGGAGPTAGLAEALRELPGEVSGVVAAAGASRPGSRRFDAGNTAARQVGQPRGLFAGAARSQVSTQDLW